MARGFVWAEYLTDDGVTYALRVDADEAADPIRGWTVVQDVATVPLPRGWLPRVVIGTDENGHPRSTRVSSVDAPLWVGDVTSFVIEGSDQLSHECQVIGRKQENTRARPTL